MSANIVNINASTPNATSTQNTLHNMAHMSRAFAGGATVCILKDTAVVKNMILRKQGVTHEITAKQYNELYNALVTTDKDGKPEITYRQVEARMKSFRDNHPLLGELSFGKWVRANLPDGDNWWKAGDARKESVTYDLHNFTGVASATPAEVPAPDLSAIEQVIADAELPPAPSLESWTVKAGDEVREYELPSEPVAVAEEASIVMIKADLVNKGVYTVAQADRTAETRLRKVHALIYGTN
jgi:hypothetical protein